MTVVELLEALYNVPFETPVKIYSDEYGDYCDATKASFIEDKETPTGKSFIVK